MALLTGFCQAFLQAFCKHFASILQAFCKHFANILKAFCKHFESILKAFWKQLAENLQAFCRHFCNHFCTHFCKHFVGIFQAFSRLFAGILQEFWGHFVRKSNCHFLPACIKKGLIRFPPGWRTPWSRRWRRTTWEWRSTPHRGRRCSCSSWTSVWRDQSGANGITHFFLHYWWGGLIS